MTKVVAKRPNGAVLIEVPATTTHLAGRMPSIAIEDIKTARREALRGTLP